MKDCEITYKERHNANCIQFNSKLKQAELTEPHLGFPFGLPMGYPLCYELDMVVDYISLFGLNQ